MCGRTACTLAPDEIKRACRYQNHGKWKEPDWKDGDQDKYKPSYNKSPQTNNPVLVSLRHFQKDADGSERVLTAMRWGLVPFWFQESDPSKMQYSTSNCRSDGMMQKKSYKDPLLKGQRCVVLADGFYEWQRQQGAKQPYFIYFPQYKQEESEDKDDFDNWKGWRLLTMAGIFDCWKPADGGDLLYSYTVITVNASKAMDWVHDRMPAILDGDEAVRRWLDFGEVSTNEAVKLIHPVETICLHPVSRIVNSTRNNSPECVKPLEIGIKEPKSTASSKMMMSWLKSESPKKKSNNPELSQMPVKDESPKKTSAGLMQLWLKKSEEPAEKKAKFS